MRGARAPASVVAGVRVDVAGDGPGLWVRRSVRACSWFVTVWNCFGPVETGCVEGGFGCAFGRLIGEVLKDGECPVNQ
jgi:hypothetical protein